MHQDRQRYIARQTEKDRQRRRQRDECPARSVSIYITTRNYSNRIPRDRLSRAQACRLNAHLILIQDRQMIINGQ